VNAPSFHRLRLAAFLTPALLLVAACSSPSDGAGAWAHKSGGGASASGDGADFDASADRSPEPGTMLAMAKICAAQGHDSECESLLTRALAAEPGCLPAYTELAALYLRHDLADSAEAVLRRGIDKAPDDSVLRNDLGMCLLLRRHYDAALAEFTRAASTPPLDARHRGNMALALGLLGRDDEALALWQQIVPMQEAQANLELVRKARVREPAQG
jgi:Flp pilus assembly protein TadD